MKQSDKSDLMSPSAGVGTTPAGGEKTFAMSARVLGMPVMCGTLEAANPAAAREGWTKKFWSDVDELRAAIPTMDDTNRKHAEQMLLLMEATRADARLYGLVVTARPSKAVHR